MNERKHSIPFILVVGGTVLVMAGLLLFFVVGCVAAALDVSIGVPPVVTFAVLFGGPVVLGALAATRHGLRQLPWGLRSPVAAVSTTLWFLAARQRHRRRCRGTDATPLARFAVLHATEAETTGNRWVTSRALAALLTDADPDIRSRAAGHFRARVERGDERLWELAEELPPETAGRIVREVVDGTQQPRAETLDYAWRLWLSQGDEELWTALYDRRLTPTGSLRRLAQLALGLREPSEQFDAATDPAVPLRVRRRCAEHCAETGQAPREPLAAVTFFLLAGCPQRYRRLDADGSLLLLANRDLHPAERLQLRTVLTELGEPELLRLLRQSPGGAVVDDIPRRPVTEPDRLRLWRSILDEPLPEAVRHAERLGEWRPPDEEQRELLRRLRAHDADDLCENPAGLETVPDRDLAMPDTSVSVVAAAVSPDGDQAAMAVLGRGPRFLEFDTATGRLLRDWAGEARSTVTGLVHTGDGLAVLHIGNERVLEHFQPPLSEHDGPRRRVLSTGTASDLRMIRPHPDGVVAAGSDLVHLRDRSGGLIDSFVADADDLRGVRAVACESSSGDIAVCAGRWVWIHRPGTGSKVQRGNWAGTPDAMVMLDDSTLVTAREAAGGEIEVSRWTVGDSGPALRTTHTVRVPHRPARLGDVLVMHRLGSTGVLVTVSASSTVRAGFGFGLDTRSMTELPLPLAPGEHVLAGSPDGRDFLTRTSGGENVVAGLADGTDVPTMVASGRTRFRVRRLGPSPLTGMFDTPMAELTLADLRTVERELRLLPDPAKPPVELLRACLRYRFGAEIALGADAGFGTDYDIGLGGDR